MSAKDDRVREIITQEAADWFINNRAGLTNRERFGFTAWLKSSPVNVEEYLALCAIAGDLRQACEPMQDTVDELIAGATIERDTSVQPLRPLLDRQPARMVSTRRQRTAIALSCLIVAGIGLEAWWSLRPTVPADVLTAFRFETGHGEQQTHRLADDSVLHLNTDSGVTIRYTAHERLIMLTSGEAEFEVTHEPTRAFRVFAGPAQVVATGTKFDVRLDRGSTVVTVLQGQVAVGSPTPGIVKLSAGQQTTVDEGQPPATPVTVEPQRTTAWLHRQISFEHEPLERVASEFNRYASKPFEITTPALQKLEISGVFAIDDSEGFIAFLRSLAGVRVEVTATHVRVSQD